MDTFKKEQFTTDSKEPLKLLQENSTRWNSSFYMIKRINKASEALNRSLLQLNKAPSPLSLKECTTLKKIETVLSCFEEATIKIQGNNYTTISLIIPLTFGIFTYLTKKLLDLTTEDVRKLCLNLLESVKTRLFLYETRSVTRLATILDPRFKKEGFRSSDNANEASSLLGQEMLGILKKKEMKTKHLRLKMKIQYPNANESLLNLNSLDF
ncbi:unnamed protein product [Psylliodes chrysocephalus]|uniref:Uncharacterized protein n=1 Tax=Psylliodes chrysocephalus TaxID=3402493 RepID=A0A9P0CRB7_9CUCU|nr:unnamed protein product [Psylliodes chrysocephala]